MQGDQHRRVEGMEAESAGGVCDNPGVHPIAVCADASCRVVQQPLRAGVPGQRLRHGCTGGREGHHGRYWHQSLSHHFQIAVLTVCVQLYM